MSHCAKCNQECFEIAAPLGHEAVKHIKCGQCGDMHPMYGDCIACASIASNAFGAKQCVAKRITFDMARKSRERARRLREAKALDKQPGGR